MTIVEGVRAWLKTYPPLAGGRLNVDCLPPDARTYAVEIVPCKEQVKAYLDGSCVKQFLFNLASREFCGLDIAQNIDNLAFYEGFSAWVEEQSRRHILPVLEEGKRAQRVEVTTSGYPFAIDDHGNAKYQIQMRLIYFQKGLRK